MTEANEDGLEFIKGPGHTMRLNENAIAAINATGASGKEFKIRHEFVESLKAAVVPWIMKDTPYRRSMIRSDAEDGLNQFRRKFMDETHEIALARLLGDTVQQKILPVVMEINGERVKVGEAVLDARDGGYCIVHAVIDGESKVAELLKTDLGHISIGNKDDFIEEQTYDNRRHAENTAIEEEIYLKNKKKNTNG